MPRSGRFLAAMILVLAFVVAGCGSGAPQGPLDVGRGIYSNICSACHGSKGQGGVGPAFEGVLETFSSCEDHQRWVSIGSDGWSKEVGDTYGDSNKPVKGGMPAHGGRLTPAEIASVAAFERSQFGGLTADVALAQCGLEASEEQ